MVAGMSILSTTRCGNSWVKRRMIITMADRTPHGRRLPARALLPVVLGLLFAPCSRAEITFTPSVLLRETWSDNANLAPSGLERSNFITELAPAFSVAANTQRV